MILTPSIIEVRVLVNKPDDYSLLLDVIKKDLHGKNYFNPSGI